MNSAYKKKSPDSRSDTEKSGIGNDREKSKNRHDRYDRRSDLAALPKYQNVWGPPEHSAIGNIHGYFVIGHYYITTCHSKQLPVCLMVLSDGMVHFWSLAPMDPFLFRV